MPEVPAKFGQALSDGSVRCLLCPLECVIPNGRAGVCRFRKNKDGQLFLTNYGEVVDIALENIEKKPLHHFFPGRKILSIGTNGCNMGCTFCQNYEISQLTYPVKNLSPDALVERLRESSESIGVCYTFNEPLTWFEYVLDTAKKVRELGYQTVINTNGLINKGPLSELLPYISAFNLDLKGFSDAYYQKICKAPLEPVLETARTLKEAGAFFEISHLIIPEENGAETLPLGEWILNNLGDDVPIHLNAYYPRYLMSHPATKEEVVLQAFENLKNLGHRYVYTGNVLSEVGQDTYCFNCETLLVKRDTSTVAVYTKDSNCQKCGSDNRIIQS